MKLPQISLREIFLLVALVAMGCGPGCWWAKTLPTSKQSSTMMTGTEEEVRVQLNELIPVGTDVAKAQKQLEKMGFKVSPGKEPESLFADMHQSTQSPWVSRRLMVVVVAPDGAVAGIQVTSGLIGP